MALYSPCASWCLERGMMFETKNVPGSFCVRMTVAAGRRPSCEQLKQYVGLGFSTAAERALSSAARSRVQPGGGERSIRSAVAAIRSGSMLMYKSRKISMATPGDGHHALCK